MTNGTTLKLLLLKEEKCLDFRKVRMGRNVTWGSRSPHCLSRGRERPDGSTIVLVGW